MAGYYTNLMLSVLESAEFAEHQQKHLMSAEETAAAVEKDLRHDSISRFFVSEEEMRNLCRFIINSNNRNMRDWLKRMMECEVGEYIKKDYDFGPLPNVVGERYSYTASGIKVEQCHSFRLTFSYKKGKTVERDRVHIVTFFPIP